MSQLNLFDHHEPPPQARRLASRLRSLAERGVFFGTSSWKYEGWLGNIYTPERYASRGKFSQKRFDDTCLAEYAEIFPVVGGDFSFYQFPTPEYWSKLFGNSPATLRFGLKVPEEITVVRWPGHARYGTRAGKDNPGFLDPELFKRQFARPLWRHRDRVATLMFEFGTFAKSTMPRPEDFFGRLHSFLGALPQGFRYSVEIRNPEYLGDPYFELLSSFNTAHVFNAWTRMPEISEQVNMPGAFTADFTVVRALLKRGRSYESAVESFSPYVKLQEANTLAREGIRRVAERSINRKHPSFVFVNNRLEGHAPTTIEEVATALEDGEST